LSQPAISQHLKELRDANLVSSERVGLEQRYRITATPLKAVYEWSAQYRQFFDPAGHAWEFVSSARTKPKSKEQNKGKEGIGNGR
jgi:DNA-binding transcriptional ArsR family regulator